MDYETLVRLGMAALLGGAAASVWFYVRSRRRLPPGEAPSFGRYVGAVLFVVIGSYVAGSMIGVFAACAGANAGNLCGLYGVFGAGPLATGIALLAHGLHWNRKIPRANG